jgi:lauroyl/myristoyl acyltransferase
MLFFTPAIHRLVPNDLALGLAAAAGSLLARHPELRRRAVVRSKVILAGTPLSGQEEVVAQRQIVEATLRAAVWMRPWYSRSRPIDGLDHLEAARRKGSGVLLVGAHIGMLSTTVHSLAGRGVRMALVAGRWILAHEDERSVQAEPTVVENVEWIYRGGAFEQMRAILDGGGVCAMSFDVPGGAKTTFLGKPSNVARGPANLAMLTGAPIVTAWADRRGLRPFVKLNPPIDPAGFASAEDLTQHLADVFSHELLRRPEALNADPTLAAVWSDVIGEDAGAFV